MDPDPCGNDNFYDENASFLPQLEDYSLEDLDEILRATNSHLDSSLNFSALGTENNVNGGGNSFGATQFPPETNDFKTNFTYDSVTATNQNAGTPPYESSSQSQRTSSISSMDGEHFNPDELMNFFNDDDVKMEDFSGETVLNMPQRNTPSPTGSCSSSGGSSTSGIQSDISSVASMPQTPRSELSTFMVEQHDINNVENGNSMFDIGTQIIEEPQLLNISPVTSTIVAATPATTTLPLSVPVLPVQTTTPTTTVTSATILQPINVVQGTIIPIKTLPLVNVKSTVPTIISPAVATTVKIEPKLAPKTVTTTTQPLKLITPKSPNTSNAAKITPISNANITTKITPPPNAKPKTIYLSSNDFKALMQKMNTNGTAGKCIKSGGPLNAQLPKIIMKTPNGKVITANKIMQPFGGGSSVPHNLMSKIVKANTPLVIKQQQQQQHATKPSISNSAIVTPTRTNSDSSYHTKSNGADVSVYKGIVDEKIVKKQQRMIKNRESASLSRKKKKEYVVSLETRINNLEKENYTLKGENTSLRSQLVAFAQTCQCKNSNVSEFILNSLNASTKVNQSVGIGGSGGGANEHQHVKIAPKPSPKSLKQRMSAATVRKNVAILFAMAFMVAINAGNFQTYFNNNAIENAIENAAAASTAAETEPVTTGRRLLWVESETEFKEKLNRTKRMNELEVPPLHFLRPVNRTGRVGGDDAAAAAAVNTADQLRNGTAREPPPLSKCGDGIAANQTENMRLVNNLQKWIDGNGYFNVSLHEKFVQDLDNNVGFKLSSDYMKWKSLEVPVQGQQKRKYFLESPRSQFKNKLRKLDTIKDNHVNDNNIDNIDNDDDDDNDNERNSLDLFKPKLSDEYIRLFKGIKRQDDTFYVLSFNMEHILLPASVYNKSARPKMSLMLPAGDPSLNGDIVLMQIDCEVVNTTEVELKSDMIPEKLRPIKYKNVNLHPATASNSSYVANNETRNQHATKNIVVPTATATATATATTPSSSAATTATNITKEKPVAKNYIIVGPNTQATALGLKKKPTIVKLSGNDRVPNIVALNVKNSTLFAKMRETVEADAAV